MDGPDSPDKKFLDYLRSVTLEVWVSLSSLSIEGRMHQKQLFLSLSILSDQSLLKTTIKEMEMRNPFPSSHSFFPCQEQEKGSYCCFCQLFHSLSLSEDDNLTSLHHAV